MSKTEFFDGYAQHRSEIEVAHDLWWDAGADMADARAAEFRAFVIGSQIGREGAMREVERIKRWKVCEQCGRHRASYIASGDDGDEDLCACCYGEPHDPRECLLGTGLDDTRTRGE